MRLTRKIVAEFVVVFLLGAVAGGLVEWCYTDTQLTTFMSRTNDYDVLVARINKKYSEQYHLTPDELKRIQPDILAFAQAVYQVRHQFGIDVMTTLRKYHEQIAAKLDPEHREAYQKAVADRDKSVSAMLMLDQSSPGQGGK